MCTDHHARQRVHAYVSYVVPVQTGSEMVLGNMGIPRLETKWSGVFGKIPDWDQDRGVWSGPDRVPIGPGPNFPNTILNHFSPSFFIYTFSLGIMTS